MKKKSVQQAWGPLHILRGLDPITVQSPYKDSFIENEKLQIAFGQTGQSMKAVGDGLDSFSQTWLRHSVHPAWIHKRFFDDKLKNYIAYVLLPFIAVNYTPLTNPLGKLVDTHMKDTGSNNALETLDYLLANARVHFISPLFMAEHREAALSGETYWVKTWGSHSMDKFAGKGMPVNECTLPDKASFPDALSPFSEATATIPVNSSLWPNQDNIEIAMVTMEKLPG